MRSKWALPAMLVAGLLIRLAYIHAQGFKNDVASFESWAITLAAHGFAHFYGTTSFLDYPPGYFYILGIVGAVWYEWIRPHDFGYAVLAELVKLPAIFADLGVGALLYAVVRRFAAPAVALGAAALYIFNPAVIFVSALWGQVDSVSAGFALLAIYCLLRSDDFERRNAAILWIVGGWLSIAYSLLIKPQAAVLLPFMIAFAFTDAARRGLRMRATAYGIVAALILTIVLVEPFHLSNPLAAVIWLLERLAYGSNVYGYNTINAFNLWAIRGQFWQPDSQLILFLPQWLWGILLVIAALALTLWRYLQAKSAQALLEASAVATLAFFMLSTRMHERYVFDGVLFTIACLPLARRYLWSAVVLSLVFWANLVYSWQYIALIANPQAGVSATNLWGSLVVLLALANVAIFFFLGYVFLGSTGEQAPVSKAVAPSTTTPQLRPYMRWITEFFWPNVRNWFDPREGLTAFRKPIDYIVMYALGIVSFVLSFAVPPYWRLGGNSAGGGLGCWPPRGTAPGLPTRCGIFDEVYFPRAAEEYLRNMRIYENTHPPLSKLLITFSTMLFGGLTHGDNPMGWRFLDVLFGALVIMLLYAFAKRVTGSTLFAAVAASLFILDGMHYVQSRIATPEGFVIFFSLAAVYAFYRFWIASQAEGRRHIVAPALGYLGGVVAAIVGGLAAAGILKLIWLPLDRASFVVVALYVACGTYLLMRYVVLPRLFADGARELTFAEGSYALERNGASEMHCVDGAVVSGKNKKTVRDDDLEITYRAQSVEYATPVGSATYADGRVNAGGVVEDGRGAKLWLLLFTLALGALVSTKWYGVMGFGVSFVTLIWIWFQRYFYAERPALWGNPRGFHLDGALVTIVFVSMTVYGLVWIPDLVRHSPDPNEIHNLNDVVARQYDMFEYHDTLRATHPYSSQWFEWPFDYVPVAYLYYDGRANTNNPKGCCIEEITSMPNPFNLWFGLLCVPIVGVLAWRERNKAYALIIITYLLQWVPWARSPRIAFEYHFYVNIPLVCLCNTIVLQRLWQMVSTTDRRTRIAGGIAVCSIVGVIAAGFVFFFPILSAWPISWNAWNARMWFPKWIIGPG